MAANIEVKASTDTAVSAFEKLANAIQKSLGRFEALENQLARGAVANSSYTSSFNSLLNTVNNGRGAFDSLLGVTNKLSDAQKRLNNEFGKNNFANKSISDRIVQYNNLGVAIQKVAEADRSLLLGSSSGNTAKIQSIRESAVQYNNLGVAIQKVADADRSLLLGSNSGNTSKIQSVRESVVQYNNLGLAIQKVAEADRSLLLGSNSGNTAKIQSIRESAVQYNNLGVAIQKVAEADKSLLLGRNSGSLNPAPIRESAVAFNNLGLAIPKVTDAHKKLTEESKKLELDKQAGRALVYSNAITSVNSAFQSAISGARLLFGALSFVGAGLQLVLNSLLGQLDKLQGFNAIMSLTTSSSAEAAQAYDFLRSTADKLGIQFDNVARDFAKLTASLPPTIEGLDTAKRAFLGISLAARTMHATGPDTNLMFYAITQMASKGVVSMEELRRQLGEKLPGTMVIAARSVNASVEDFTKAVSNGTVDSAKFLKAFSDELIRTFSDSAAKAGTSVSAALARLTNVWVDFSKTVLDSGGADAIANTLDTLRSKLTDPYVVQRFAELVKYLADRVTEFINSLTRDDIRNGFDTFTKFAELTANAVGKLISALTWIINNGTKAGAIIGAVAGASIGATTGLATAGPLGALYGAGAGAIAGVGAGAYLGSQVKPTAAQAADRIRQDKSAEQAANDQFKRDDQFKFTVLKPMLKNFKGLDPFAGLENLYKPDKLNQSTIADLNKILTGKEYKTDAARNEAVKLYAKSNQVLGPNTVQLSDVTTPGKPGKDKSGLEASYNKALGLNPDFDKEMRNYNTLLKQGRLTSEEYEDAKARLIAQQPAFSKAAKTESDDLKRYNKDLNTNMDLAFKLVEAKEDIQRELDKEHALAGLTADNLEVENKLTDIRNKLIKAGADETYAAAKAESYRNTVLDDMRLKEVTNAENAVLAATVDKYRQLITIQQAIDKSLSDPSSGLTPQAANDYVINSDSGFEGSTSWIDAQRRSIEEYYAYIDLLRNKDRIDDEAANLAKGKATVELQQKITAAYVDAATLRTQAGSTDWVDVAISSLGRLAIGFTNLTAGTTAQLGTFFQSFTDGFANSIGRAVVYSENLGEALKNVAREGISTLISSLVKLGIQWLVNAALGQSIAASSAAAGVGLALASGAATAAAWAPAAALVSLATLGANGAPAAAAIIATTSLAQTSAIAGMAGFSQGGYTGSGSTSGVAGVVHGQEFVVNASATARNREILEAINSGANVSASAGSGSGPITVQSPAVNQKIINIIDPSMIKDYLNSDAGEQVIINVVRRNKDSLGS